MEHILSFGAQYDMLPRDGLILVALSGGGDSVALLHFLKSQGFRVAAAHFNHHLRETARRDALFCQGLCRDWEIPFFNWGARVGEMPGNTEANARAARYGYLERLSAGLNAARVATAHTANDNLETVLLHLTRGCGLQGLTGIEPRRGKLVRPMLHTTRRAVEDYLAQHHLPYVTDETNLDDRYARNRIRHQVVPVLESLNPQAVRACCRMTDRLREDALRLGPREAPPAPPAALPPLEPQRVKPGDGCVTPLWTLETHLMDACPDTPPTPAVFYLRREGMEGDITLRSRRIGDRLHPPFRTGKTVKKWLNELGVPPHLREGYPVAEWSGRVAAVAGIGPQADLLAAPGEPAVLFRWTPNGEEIERGR